jgi:pectate lyase
MNMKKQIMMLMAVLLVSVTAIAVTSLPGLHSNTFHLSVTIDPANAGSVDRPERDIVAGGKATFTATANPGFGFNGWYVDGELVSTANPYQFTNIQSDINIVAKFNSLAASVLTCSVKSGSEGMGTVTVSPEGTVNGNSHTLTTGTSVTLKATPAIGHEFVRWEDGTGATVSTSSSYSFTIMSDMTLYAVFKMMENYHADLISFPGAEGYGRFTTGGRAVDSRGSKVYYVTRLDDSEEEGTFRWAATTGDDTPRTILFKVAGTIYLTSNVTVKANTTVAGQTAPAGGICFAGYRIKLSSNTILRHLRFRAGDLPNKSMSPLGVENVENIIIDHCSLGWSMEENLTLYDNNNTTTQWCIFAEGLYDSRNTKGNRAYGAQWGGKRSTMHHCLFAHNNSRSPRFNGVRPENHDRQAINEFVNNVIFNWGSPNAIYGGENSAGGATDYNRVYMINNYYKPGPATKNATSSRRYWVSASGDQNGVGQWYLKGNKFELSSKWAPTSNIWKDTELQKVNDDNYYGFVSNNSSRAMNFWSLSPSQSLADKALLTTILDELPYTNYETADVAYAKVVTQAGASLPRYDEVDARVLAEAAGTQDPQYGGARGAKMGIIDSPYDITLKSHDEFAALYEGDNAADNKEIDVTCYPRLQMDSYDCAVVDTDGDGLPDAYETEVGLNPNDASDGGKLSTSGYSNLEVFLNGVADGQIDAKLYTQHQAVSKMNDFNAIVGEGGYATVQEAVNAAPNDATPYYIFIKKGVYEGHVQINRTNVHLTGQNKLNTIISWNKTNADGGGVDYASTVNVTANDVSFDNLTIRNTRTNEGQALALYTKADRVIVTNSNLEGWQDTYRTGKDGQRHLVRNSKITGTTDFIYGAGEAFFDSDTLHVLQTSNVIVAPDHSSPKYGYVLKNCVITAAKSGSKTNLGRPWGNTPKVSYVNTQLTSGVSITDAGWVDMGGLPTQMAEYNTVDANGNAVDLSKRKTSFTAEGNTKTSKAVLGKVEADSYKLDYVLRGSDEWDADWQAFILPAPYVYVSGGTISWADPTGFAQCYLVIADGVATMTTDTSRADDGKLVTVQCVSAYGVVGEMASSDHPTGISQSKSCVQVVRRQYYTTDGRLVNRLQHGLNIIRETLSDGTTRTTKIMAK